MKPLLTFVLCVFLATPAAAQFGRLKKLAGGGGNEDEKKVDDAAAAAGEAKDGLQKGSQSGGIKSPCFGGDEITQEEAYLRIREFSQGLMTSNEGGFRDEVQDAYIELMRQHGDEAYNINRSAKSEVVFVIEDRFRVFEGLYDNLMVQDLVNQIGQKVTPKGSDKLYAFKLIADPVPKAWALSTGTIYVSTGLVAMLDNEAQLAFVLAHEAAHVHNEHWQERLMMESGRERFFTDCEARQAKKAQRIGLVGAIGGAIVGGATKGGANAVVAGAVVGAAVGYAAMKLLQGDPRFDMDWNTTQEDEADATAFQALLDAQLNVREAPRLYLALEEQAGRDSRMELGFLGERERVRQRYANLESMLQNAQYAEQITGATLGSDGPGFKLLMAELKRDNGILAYHHDMLEVARRNLEEAATVRDSDPTALYYYAKVLKLVGKTEDDAVRASEYFARAAAVDQRNQNPGAFLHRAVTLMDVNASDIEKQQAVEMLKNYVSKYAQARFEADKERIYQQVYPPHLDTIYDYMSRLGNMQWRAEQFQGHELPVVEFKPVADKAPAAKAPVKAAANK